LYDAERDVLAIANFFWFVGKHELIQPEFAFLKQFFARLPNLASAARTPLATQLGWTPAHACSQTYK